MAKYVRPSVQFRPRNKREARQWRRDKNQLKYERNWQRTSKTHNPLTGKKNYTTPKADLYQSKDLQKTQIQYVSGYSSHNSTPKFGSTVFSLVSLLLVVGLLASMFFVFQNLGRPQNTPFVYFSPQVFLRNISSDSVVIDGGTYTVEYEYEKAWYQFDGKYWGYITVNGKRIKSATFINEFNINNLEQKMFFVIDRVQYWTTQHEIQGPGLTGITVIRQVELPDLYLEWGNPPEINEIVSAWEDLDGIEGIANALGETAYFVHDWFKYQANLLFALLPWNSATLSNETPCDGVTPQIPWRDEYGNITEVS